MAGTNSTSGYVFNNEGTVEWNQGRCPKPPGRCSLFTDAAYPSMNLGDQTTAAVFTPLVSGATGTALYQGTIALNGDTTMYGLVSNTVFRETVSATPFLAQLIYRCCFLAGS